MKPVVYGADWCPYCQALKQWLDQEHIAYEERNVDAPGVRAEMNAKTNDNQTIPVLFIGESYYINPDKTLLAKLFNDKEQAVADNPKVHEVVMIGAGPAALSAAIYTTREDIETVLIEKGVIGGLAAITDQVDNYPGFPEGITGLDLAGNLQAQAERFGAQIELAEVSGITEKDGIKHIATTDGEYLARAVLIATGSDYKKLGVPGEDTFYGHGVHFCATCDGAFYRGKRLVTVGSGNSSAQESLFLTRFADHIDVLIRGDAWKASDVLIKQIEDNPKITVHFNTTTDEIVGVDGNVKKVVGTDTKTNQKVEFETDGVFVFIGLKPNTSFLGTSLELDEIGFVKTNDHLETNLPGVFAAGDVRSGATMQIASAVGEGATAALHIREYLAEHK